ncbi:MAG: Ig-like domain-containing protein [Dysgonamonadaceae bacterium]|jgi:hypothetical protein|nr:Ig-like domain-containing protein [Dysgonamonadaceae bacterium]
MKNLIVSLSFLVSIAAFSGCTDEDSGKPVLESIQVTPPSLDLLERQTSQLIATPVPADADVVSGMEWTSAHDSVATVTPNGFVTGHKEGATVITVTCGDVKQTVNVTVRFEAIPLTAITLTVPKPTMQLKDVQKLIASPVPANATDYNPVWSVTPEGIVSVTQTGEVTALSDGKATVKVTSGAIETSFELTVEKPTPKKLDKTGWVITNHHSSNITDGGGFGRVPNNMIDDYATTGEWAEHSFWQSNWLTSSFGLLPFWFIIDMQKSYSISQFEINIPKETLNDAKLSKGYFEVSEDLSEWNQKVEFEIPLTGDRLDYKVDALPQTEGRYFKFTITESHYERVSVSNLEVIGY